MKTFIIAVLCVCLTGCQSGCTSRYTGGTTKLPVPTDAVQIINMSKSGKNKYIVYRDINNKVIMKEYTDFGVFEAAYELENITVDGNLTIKR